MSARHRKHPRRTLAVSGFLASAVTASALGLASPATASAAETIGIVPAADENSVQPGFESPKDGPSVQPGFEDPAPAPREAPAPTPAPQAEPEGGYATPLLPYPVAPQTEPEPSTGGGNGGGSDEPAYYVQPAPQSNPAPYVPQQQGSEESAPAPLDLGQLHAPEPVAPKVPLVPKDPNVLQVGVYRVKNPDFIPIPLKNSINANTAIVEADVDNAWRSIGVPTTRAERMATAGVGSALLAGTGAAVVAGGTAAAVGAGVGAAVGAGVGFAAGSFLVPGVGWVPGVPLGAGVGAATGAAVAGVPVAAAAFVAGATAGGIAGTLYGAGDQTQDPTQLPPLPGTDPALPTPVPLDPAPVNPPVEQSAPQSGTGAVSGSVQVSSQDGAVDAGAQVTADASTVTVSTNTGDQAPASTSFDVSGINKAGADLTAAVESAPGGHELVGAVQNAAAQIPAPGPVHLDVGGFKIDIAGHA